MFHRIVLGFVVLQTFVPLARADIALLREKGPKSGAIFSNPGILAEAPGNLNVSMKSASVQIRLRAADGGNLAAECTADFELVDNRNSGMPQLIPVAFPVTGLHSKVVEVEKFHVTADGVEPATVFRRSISLGRREYKLSDSKVSGQLDARFAPEHSGSRWAVLLKDQTGYRDAYVWQQTMNPGATASVRVTYTVVLRPQSVHYSKTYEQSDDATDVIPFHDLGIDSWEDQYFFFDYVLLSGATWDGPIGRETIQISADPELKLDARRVESFYRHQPVAVLPFNHDMPGGRVPSLSLRPGGLETELKDEKPTCDLLIAIPKSAVTLLSHPKG